jgi:hypothetical protein
VQTGDDPLPSALYPRVVIYAYIVFWAVWHADLDASEIARLNWLIVALWGVQFFAAAVEVFVLGERTEANVGTLSSTGGGAAAVLPLFVMVYAMSFYLYCGGHPFHILLTVACGLVGYASGKRAFYFLMPPVYLVLLVWYNVREAVPGGLRRCAGPVLVFCLAAPLLLYGLSHSHGISSGYSDDSVLDKVRYALEAGRQYTLGEDEDQYTIGRTSTSTRVLQALLYGDMRQTLFGLGPSSLISDKKAKDALEIGYGVTGWARDAVSIGIPGMLLHVGFYVHCGLLLLRRPRQTANVQQEALRFGTLVSFCLFLLMYFVYCDAFVMAGWMTFPMFYLAAIVLSPNYRSLWETDLESVVEYPEIEESYCHGPLEPDDGLIHVGSFDGRASSAPLFLDTIEMEEDEARHDA